MAHQYLNDGEEEEAPIRPADEPERHEGSHEDVSAEEASSQVDEPVSASATSNRSRRNNKHEGTPEMQAESDAEDTVVSSEEDDLRKLEAQGFTPDEVTRLVDLSARLNDATLKRLQFTKWLVEQGLLDEFSVRSE